MSEIARDGSMVAENLFLKYRSVCWCAVGHSRLPNMRGNMRCWRCSERDEYSELGLCRPCRDELDDEKLIPPGRLLHPPGTLPEEIGPYRTPVPSDYRTTPY